MMHFTVFSFFQNINHYSTYLIHKYVTIVLIINRHIKQTILNINILSWFAQFPSKQWAAATIFNYLCYHMIMIATIMSDQGF